MQISQLGAAEITDRQRPQIAALSIPYAQPQNTPTSRYESARTHASGVERLELQLPGFFCSPLVPQWSNLPQLDWRKLKPATVINATIPDLSAVAQEAKEFVI